MTNNVITSNVAVDTGNPWYRKTILSIGADLDFQNNDIYDNTADSLLYLGVNPTIETYDISGNWWGTTDISLIETQAYDYEDNYQLPKTNFAPMLDSPAN